MWTSYSVHQQAPAACFCCWLCSRPALLSLTVKMMWIKHWGYHSHHISAPMGDLGPLSHTIIKNTSKPLEEWSWSLQAGFRDLQQWSCYNGTRWSSTFLRYVPVSLSFDNHLYIHAVTHSPVSLWTYSSFLSISSDCLLFTHPSSSFSPFLIHPDPSLTPSLLFPSTSN